ncbi:MAG: zinc ribbon domain-containing protein [Verrucomicrobiota bacterium]
MPNYEYFCDECGAFEVIRPMSEYDCPFPCPDCGKESPRVVLSAPNVSTLAGQVRRAHAVN